MPADRRPDATRLPSAPPSALPDAGPEDAGADAVLGLRRPLLIALAFSAVINLLTLTGSLYMLQVYDRVLASGSVQTLLGLFVIVAVLHGFLALYDVLRARLLSRAGAGLDRRVGPRAFALSLGPDPCATPGANPGPEAQPLRDLDALRGFLSGAGATALLDAPWAPIFLAALFLVHPVLGWLTVGGAALAAALALLNHLLTRGAIARAMAREAEERDLAERARRGAEAVAGLGMGPALLARWQERRDAALLEGQAAGDPGEVLAGLSRATRMLLQSAILTAGAWLVIAGEISGGMIVAASILSGRALAPVDQIVGNWRAVHRAVLARRALVDLLARQAPEPARLRLPDPEGHLEVRDLTRLAGPGRPPVLDGVAFALRPGDGLAVTGPSGSGKSTLARLLVGALPADRGEVRLDGATLDQWEPERLGRHLGYLPQTPCGLTGSVRDLIARFDRSVTDAEVIAAARLAGIHDLVLSLPQGYATLIGGRGGLALSGGQAQRLGLARAVCRMPRLVVLDEPDAHLDAAGEAALLGAIRALRAAGSAVVVVAHRPGTLAALGKVLALEAGRVARFGDLAAPPAVPPAAPAPAPAPALALADPLPPVRAPAAAPIPFPARLQPAAAFGSEAPPEAPVAAPRPPRAVADSLRRLSERRAARQVLVHGPAPAPSPRSATA